MVYYSCGTVVYLIAAHQKGFEEDSWFIMSHTESPTRRVLGDKSTNTRIQNQSFRQEHKPQFEQTKGVVQQPVPMPVLLVKSTPPGSPRIGQKRRIEEVDGSNAEDSQHSHPTQRLSQASQLFSDSGSERGGSSNLFESTTRSAQTRTSSFLASQGSAPLEMHFEIQEEMSQHTLDKMHAISLPPNASQLEPSPRPNLEKENSQLSVSMSSLIDFDQSDSSSGEDGVQLILETKNVKVNFRDEDESRKEMLNQKAEALRTRLQLAIFKVQTNQISKPFSRLNVPTSKSSPPKLLAVPPSNRIPESRQMSSPESRIAIMRARATMQQKPKVKALNSLPVPKIVPSTYSARWNESSSTVTENLPSSPPISRQTLGEVQEGNQHKTPVSQKERASQQGGRSLPLTPMQLSSPPQSEAESDNDVEMSEDRKRNMHSHDRSRDALTSSVVKGEAANGLLELMRSSRGDVVSSGGAGMCGL